MKFSRTDRNNRPLTGHENGRLNDQISELEQLILASLRKNPKLTNAELMEITGKSQSTITRVLAALKGKDLLARMGSRKSGYRKVK